MKIKNCVKLKRCACGGKPIVNLGDEYYKGVYEMAVWCSKCNQGVGSQSLTEFIINSTEINKMFMGWNYQQSFFKFASRKSARLDKENKRHDHAIKSLEQQFILDNDKINAKNLNAITKAENERLQRNESLKMSWMANNLTQKGLKKVLEDMEEVNLKTI